MDEKTNIEVSAEDADAYYDSTERAVEEYLKDLESVSDLQDLIRVNAAFVGKMVDAYDLLLAPNATKH